ncbi:MAG: isoprenylcysteine carboxylmethyltransferase family protein [Halomonadaceae bacterium]|uniref:Isoprenylcysteine carboxylmethyltransferase family protein n=1 Tax=Candidatus Halomonas stercoripullorum TaxID=2838617 RepID=A0A9D2B4K2_9GAMM|nr:isoprenylcysteine carboxylmethyltransferase family protein [Halomonadaceae bacterium]HIX60895.1 isoprenylcysteine carboxylmethyltransferase family protein [Candidatus Halomonas stercoripullorum]
MTLRIPPPLVVLVAALLIWIIARYFPMPLLVTPAISIIAGVIAACGIAVVLLGVAAFRQSQTTLDPLHPEDASSLVTRGVYQYTRNPMYLGFALVLLAWALYLSAWLGLLIVGVYVAYMNRFQIKPEEKALESRFGQEFLQYKKAVRRWL